MLTLKPETASLINDELESIPERYQKPFNSVHEALGVIREEYIELEQEIFFGEKKAKEHHFANDEFPIDPKEIWNRKIKREAIQVAAMCARLIQEL